MNAIQKITRLLRKLLIPLFALVVLSLLVIHETGMLEEHFGPGNPLTETGVAAAEPTPSPGEPVAIERRELPLLRTALGTVAPRRLVTVAPRILGAVVELPVVEGDVVEKGALLARFDDRDLRAKLAAAEAAREVAVANVEAEKARRAGREAGLIRAKSELVRVGTLLAREAATPREFEAAEAAERAAVAEVAAIDAAVRSAGAAVEMGSQQVEEMRTALGHAELHAPQAGVVASLETELGELAAPGRPLLTLFDPADLRLEVAIPAEDGERVAIGSRLHVEVPASGFAAEGTVESIDPLADAASRTLRVRIALPAGVGLRAGLFGRVRYEIATESALVVPAAAVRRTGQVETVRLLTTDGRVRVRHLRTGRTVGDGWLELLSGLSEGDLALVGGDE
jgi:HlyD family secretion protein